MTVAEDKRVFDQILASYARAQEAAQVQRHVQEGAAKRYQASLRRERESEPDWKRFRDSQERFQTSMMQYDTITGALSQLFEHGYLLAKALSHHNVASWGMRQVLDMIALKKDQKYKPPESDAPTRLHYDIQYSEDNGFRIETTLPNGKNISDFLGPEDTEAKALEQRTKQALHVLLEDWLQQKHGFVSDGATPPTYTNGAGEVLTREKFAALQATDSFALHVEETYEGYFAQAEAKNSPAPRPGI